MDAGIEEVALFAVEAVGGGELGLFCLVFGVVPFDVVDLNRSENVGELRAGRERVEVFIDAAIWILGVADVDNGGVVQRVGSLELGGDFVGVVVVETTLEFDVLDVFTLDDVDGIGLGELVDGRHVFVSHSEYPEVLVILRTFGLGTLYAVMEFDVPADDTECRRGDCCGSRVVRVWWFNGHVMRPRVLKKSDAETDKPSAGV